MKKLSIIILVLSILPFHAANAAMSFKLKRINMVCAVGSVDYDKATSYLEGTRLTAFVDGRDAKSQICIVQSNKFPFRFTESILFLFVNEHRGSEGYYIIRGSVSNRFWYYTNRLTYQSPLVYRQSYLNFDLENDISAKIFREHDDYGISFKIAYRDKMFEQAEDIDFVGQGYFKQYKSKRLIYDIFTVKDKRASFEFKSNIDSFEIDEQNSLGKIVKDLDFEPKSWRVLKNITARFQIFK